MKEVVSPLWRLDQSSGRDITNFRLVVNIIQYALIQTAFNVQKFKRLLLSERFNV